MYYIYYCICLDIGQSLPLHTPVNHICGNKRFIAFLKVFHSRGEFNSKKCIGTIYNLYRYQIPTSYIICYKSYQTRYVVVDHIFCKAGMDSVLIKSRFALSDMLVPIVSFYNNTTSLPLFHYSPLRTNNLNLTTTFMSH